MVLRVSKQSLAPHAERLPKKIPSFGEDMDALQARPTLAFVAGEASGDMLGGAVLKALAQHSSDNFEYCGIGGTHMAAAGFTAQWPVEKLAVRGYVEAIAHLPEILSIRKKLTRQLLNAPPEAFLGIDAPDFNLGLELKLREKGIPTIHFVSPSIWAWRGNRIKKIACAVDHMLCVFPFEEAIYKNAGISAQYVGHPLADQIPLLPDVQSARQCLGITSTQRLIAVLPGSRVSEIRLIAPAFFAAMQQMHLREPDLQFVVPAATPALRVLLGVFQVQYPELPLKILDGNAHTAMEAADVVLLASGTATLEAALYKKPMVIAYKVPWLTAQVMKRQGYLPYIGLPNILAGQFVVPELLQDAATPQALAAAVLKELHDTARQKMLLEIFGAIHKDLRCNAASQAAQSILEIVQNKRNFKR